MRKLKLLYYIAFQIKRGGQVATMGKRGKVKLAENQGTKRCFSPSNPNAIQAKSKASYSSPETLQSTVKRKVKSKDPANMRLLSEDVVWWSCASGWVLRCCPKYAFPMIPPKVTYQISKPHNHHINYESHNLSWEYLTTTKTTNVTESNQRKTTHTKRWTPTTLANIHSFGIISINRFIPRYHIILST